MVDLVLLGSTLWRCCLRISLFARSDMWEYWERRADTQTSFYQISLQTPSFHSDIGQKTFKRYILSPVWHAKLIVWLLRLLRTEKGTWSWKKKPTKTSAKIRRHVRWKYSFLSKVSYQCTINSLLVTPHSISILWCIWYDEVTASHPVAFWHFVKTELLCWLFSYNIQWFVCRSARRGCWGG